MSPERTVFYLYCLTAPGATVPPGLLGVEERPVSLRKCGSANAVVSEIGETSFCGGEAEKSLQSLDWVGPRALGHEQVIEQVMKAGPVLPVGFATLFTSIESLQQTIERRGDTIAAFFRELGDSQEWAVKGLLLHPAAVAGDEAPTEPSPRAISGASYLFQKQARMESERASGERLKEVCRVLAADLHDLVRAFKERKVIELDQEAAKIARAVFNWAFLVERTSAAAFAARVQAAMLQERFPGLRLALSGPWPAFSFAPNLEIEEAR